MSQPAPRSAPAWRIARLCVAALFALALVLPGAGCSQGDLDDLARCLGAYDTTTVTVRFNEIAPWEGHEMTWRLEGGCVSDDHAFEIRDDDHDDDLEDVHVASTLVLKAWIDLDGDGVYDAPPTDASWRVNGSVGTAHGFIGLNASAGQVNLGRW